MIENGTNVNPQISKIRIAIIGGGPAGSTCANYLQSAGIQTTIFEKAKFPRPHIGESLNPSVMHILEEIGLTPSDFGDNQTLKKKISWSLPRKLYGYDLDTKAMHVVRSHFDKVLLDKAIERGAQHIFGKVKDVCFDSEKPVVEFQAEGELKRETFDFVVDASGRKALIARKLGLITKFKDFNQIAIHANFSNYTIPAEEIDTTVLHFLPDLDGWCWQIPTRNDICSFGVVIPRDRVNGSIESSKKFFWGYLEKARPDLYERLKQAKQVSDFAADANYSYMSNRLADKNYALIGDASGYIDPIYSAGIGFATHGGKYLAQDIIKCLKENKPLNGNNFSQFHEKIGNGIYNWKSIISMYYELQVVMTYFIDHSSDRELLIELLNGTVYDHKLKDLISRMRGIIDAVKENESHPWNSFIRQRTLL